MKTEQTAALFLTFFLGIPLNFLITAPVIQDIWRMLVIPYYKHIIPVGVILFIFLVKDLIFFNLKKNHERNFLEIFADFVLFYLRLSITWGIAWIYSNFI